MPHSKPFRSEAFDLIAVRVFFSPPLRSANVIFVYWRSPGVPITAETVNARETRNSYWVGRVSGNQSTSCPSYEPEIRTHDPLSYCFQGERHHHRLHPKPPDVMTILAGTVAGAILSHDIRLWSLTLLRKLGWVQCDVSIGNILSHERSAKLADLEYAKRRGDTKSHEMRTASRSSFSLSRKPLIVGQ